MSMGNPSCEPYDVVEPIRGYRVWNVDRRNRKLTSSLFQVPWDRDMIAEGCETNCWETDNGLMFTAFMLHGAKACSGPPCDRPIWGHGCGIYALKSLARAVDEAVNRASGVILGEVLLHGKVQEHEFGYRASHARIDCLYQVTDLGRWLRTEVDIALPGRPTGIMYYTPRTLRLSTRTKHLAKAYGVNVKPIKRSKIIAHAMEPV